MKDIKEDWWFWENHIIYLTIIVYEKLYNLCDELLQEIYVVDIVANNVWLLMLEFFFPALWMLFAKNA